MSPGSLHSICSFFYIHCDNHTEEVWSPNHHIYPDMIHTESGYQERHHTDHIGLEQNCWYSSGHVVWKSSQHSLNLLQPL